MNNEKLSTFFKSTIGVGILSWKSHKTLEKSLLSYEKNNFKDFFDESKIIFQEISSDDISLAQKYGYDYVGTSTNKGIQAGHKLIYENLLTDYILILENDNPLVESVIICEERLKQAIKYLENKEVDIVRLRHRWNFGEGFSLEKYLSFYSINELNEKYSYKEINEEKFDFIKKIKRFFRPDKAQRVAGYSLYFEKNPHKVFPEFIKKIEDDFFSVSSNIMPWTNQSVLISRKLYGELLDFAYNNPSSRTSNGFQDLEKPLNCKWWRNQNFRIGVSEGIFTHNRFDDSWRKTHHAFNKNIVI